MADSQFVIDIAANMPAGATTIADLERLTSGLTGAGKRSDDDQVPLPDLTEGDSVSAASLTASGHETKPPARYTEPPDLFYVPKPEHVGYQDKKNKQGREGVHEYASQIAAEIQRQSAEAHGVYRSLIRTGMAKASLYLEVR